MLTNLLPRPGNRQLIENLHGRIVAAARRPALFLPPYEVPDTLDGRFDLLVLLTVLVLRRLESLRRELVGTGVDVIVIQPGSIRTAIWEKIATFDVSRAKGTVYERPLEKMKAMALRSGERGLPAEDVARAILSALAARRPPTRMLVVHGGTLKRRLFELLPDRWIDRHWRPAGGA